MIEKIQVKREKILYINFLIHFLQDTINYLSDETTLKFVDKLGSWNTKYLRKQKLVMCI